jgi:sarcosine/dimethylglycine N-methyltransferase
MTTHEEQVISYYATQTELLYMRLWDDEDIHFGIFDDELIARLEDIPQGGTFKRALRKMTDTIVSPAGIREGDLVVDAGSGIGGASRYLAQRFNCSVIGINISDRQIDIARLQTAAAGLQDRVTFRRGNCSAYLPVDTASVDVIVNLESACHYADRQKFLLECARILKPAGRLAASDWLARDGMKPDDYQRYIQPVCDEWFLWSLETQQSYRQLLDRAGLRVDEFEILGDDTLENARIMDRIWRQLTRKQTPSQNQVMWMKQFRCLSAAWLSGYFEIGRYIAVTP